MANPFFIPRRNDAVAQVTDFAARLDANRQRNKLMQEDVALRGRAQDFKESQFAPGGAETRRLDIAERGVDQTKRRTDLMQEQFDLKKDQVPAYDKKTKPKEVNELYSRSLSFDEKNNSGVTKKSTRLFNAFDDYAKRNMSHEETYTGVKQNWPFYSQPIIEQLKKDHQAALKEGPPGRPNPKAAEIGNMLDLFTSGKALDIMFPASAVHTRQQQEATDIKRLAATPSGKALKAYITPEKTIAYLPSNQMPPAGYVPYTSGIKAEMNPDTGEFSLQTGVSSVGQGAASSLGIERGTKAFIEKELLKTKQNLSNMRNLESLYKPEFQELGTRWDAWATKWKEKAKGTKAGAVLEFLTGKIAPEDKQLLSDYVDYQSLAMSGLNRGIKDITGAQMSEKEVGRLTKEFPNPGQGLFDGDSPTEFDRKSKNKIKILTHKDMRLSFYLSPGTENYKKNSLSMNAIENIIATPGGIEVVDENGRPTDDIKQVYDKIGEEIFRNIMAKNPGMDSDDAFNKARDELKIIFGLPPR